MESGPAGDAPTLTAVGVGKQFGALVVLDDVALEVRAGHAVGIVGPNGAGKTTLLDVLSGAQRANAGTVTFQGEDVTRLNVAARCRLGIGRTHQVPRPFVDMTVFENVLVGTQTGGALRGSEAREHALGVLETTGLMHVANRRAATLGLLDRKRLEMARALATDPVVLLLDEIAGGLTEEETHVLVASILELRERGLGIVWIEHVVHALLQVAQSLICMSAGRVIAEGEPQAVMSDPAVIEAYLGQCRMSVLSVEELEVRHGLLQAVRGVSLQIEAGETLALVGANGAGKSTLLRAIAGAPPRPTAGRVLLDDEDVTAVRPHVRVSKGIALVPEGRQLFVSLTVEENLLVAAGRKRSGAWTVDSVLEAFPLLRERRHHRAGTLSGGERQATAIGRALMTNPRVLLLDEVSLGLAPVAVEDVYRSLTTVIESGTAVVLVEQDLTRALNTATRVLCMLEGRIVLEGASADLTREQVTDAYFGLARGGGAQGTPGMTWVNAVIQGILLGGLYALFATGLSLLYGVMKIINLAHGDLALLGAFGVVVVLDHSGLTAFAAMLIVIPAAAALGWLLDRLIFERALRGGELSPLLATFGLSIVIGNLLLELFSSDSHSFSAGALETSAWHINSEISIAALPALIFLVAVAVLGGLQLFLSRARMGREMRATADDPVTAELVGIDARRIYATAAAISVATAALAGIFNGMRSSFDPTQGSSLLIFGFEAVIIGGLGSLWGTLIGGIILGVAQTVAAQHDPSWSILAGNFVFLAILAFRQQGILGARETRSA